MRKFRALPGSKIIASEETNDAIFAADLDDDFDEDSIGENIDDIADSVEELQDDMEDVEEDSVDIEIDNNIDGHYIAECSSCHGIFISPVVETDQDIECISGVCPLCNKHSDQELKWVVKDRERSAE